MKKIIQKLFDLKREIENKQNSYVASEYTHTNEIEYEYNKCKTAIIEVDALLATFKDNNPSDNLTCEKRNIMGTSNRCMYCDAYSDERCLW